MEHKLNLSILDNLYDGAFAILNKKFIYVNHSCANMLGYEIKDVLNKHMDVFVYEDDKKFLNDRHEKRLQGQEVPEEYEVRLQHKNGDIVYVIISVKIILHNNKKVTIGTCKNVTNRIQTEMKLKETENTYKAVLELIPDPIIISDLQGNIVMYNRAAHLCHKANGNFRLEGKNVLEFIPYENEKMLIQSLINKDDVQKYTIHFRNQIGNLIPYELNTSTIYDKDGNPKYRITVGRDISELKIYEKNLKNLLEEKEIVIREIHHRIKNSLQQIHSLLGLQVESEFFSYKLKNTADTQNDVCYDILYKVINDTRRRILSISLIHQMFYKENTVKISFKDFISNISDEILKAYYIPNKVININVHGDSMNLCLDHMIPCGLIINEIISNSFKHAFNDRDIGNIDIILNSDGNKNTILISDDGSGFSIKKTLPNKTLGLSLIYGLAKEQLNGEITCESTGQGTKYEITFKKEKKII